MVNFTGGVFIFVFILRGLDADQCIAYVADTVDFEHAPCAGVMWLRALAIYTARP